MSEMDNILAAGIAVFAWFGIPLCAWWWWQARGKAWVTGLVVEHHVKVMIRNYKRGRRSHW